MSTEQADAELETSLAAPKALITQFSYSVGQYSILLEPQVHCEVVETQTISDVPFSPDWCLGLASSRGELYPVMDMHKVILDQASPAKIKLLLIKHPQFSPILLACDGYASQQNVPEKVPNQQENENLPAWISYSLMHHDQALLVADHARLLRHVQRISSQHSSHLER